MSNQSEYSIIFKITENQAPNLFRTNCSNPHGAWVQDESPWTITPDNTPALIHYKRDEVGSHPKLETGYEKFMKMIAVREERGRN